jgi:cell division protein FtsB
LPAFTRIGDEMETPLKSDILMIAVLIMLLLMGLMIIFGKKGLLDLNRHKEEKAALQMKVLQIEKDNQDLMRIIKRLEKEDSDLMEQLAKHEHKMVRENEIVIIPNAARSIERGK